MNRFHVYCMVLIQLIISSWLEYKSVALLSYRSVISDRSKTCQSSIVSNREFIPYPRSNQFNELNLFPPDPNPLSQQAILRVMQFNVLADGLTCKRQNYGGFSRAKPEILDWEFRKERLIYEIVQYNPDIITMQEVDHYYDFFWPELSKRGYKGFFAPKPTSACLEVGPNADGCAMFIKGNKFRVVTSETKTLALSKAELTDSGELNEDDKAIRAQNQVALVVVCEILGENGELLRKSDYIEGKQVRSTDYAPPIIIGTTHLKSSKTLVGEKFRKRGITQILESIEKMYERFTEVGSQPAVILTGDFNAVVEKTSYDPLTYRAIKASKLNLRSVYNEDVAFSSIKLSSEDVYTTWKARVKTEGEEIVKRCIDYIFYVPFKPTIVTEKAKASNSSVETFIAAAEPAGKELITEDRIERVAISYFLRLTVYSFAIFVPLSSLVTEKLEWFEKGTLCVLAFIGFIVFERISEGTIFKPLLDYRITKGVRNTTENTNNEVDNAKVLFPSSDESSPRTESNPKEITENMISPLLSFYRNARMSEIELLRSFAKKGQQFLPTQQLGRPGFRLISVLDLFPEKSVEPELLPSEKYPSDHVAIGADLQLLW